MPCQFAFNCQECDDNGCIVCDNGTIPRGGACWFVSLATLILINIKSALTKIYKNALSGHASKCDQINF